MTSKKESPNSPGGRAPGFWTRGAEKNWGASPGRGPSYQMSLVWPAGGPCQWVPQVGVPEKPGVSKPPCQRSGPSCTFRNWGGGASPGWSGLAEPECSVVVLHWEKIYRLCCCWVWSSCLLQIVRLLIISLFGFLLLFVFKSSLLLHVHLQCIFSVVCLSNFVCFIAGLALDPELSIGFARANVLLTYRLAFLDDVLHVYSTHFCSILGLYWQELFGHETAELRANWLATYG